MNLKFGLPILIAFALAMSTPYMAISLSRYSFILLALLIFSVGFKHHADQGTTSWTTLKKNSLSILISLFFLYGFYPLVILNLAQFFINDSDFIFGIYFAQLMPVAIVSPLFTKLINGNEDFSYQFMIISTLLHPLALILMLPLAPSVTTQIDILVPLKFSLLIVTIPTILSLLTAKYFSHLKLNLKKWFAPTITFILAVLIYIQVGSVMNKVNLNYGWQPEIYKLFLFAIFQDFGVLVLHHWIFKKLFKSNFNSTMAVSLSMKNVAIGISILIFYNPKAALPSCLVFIVHAILFSTIGCFKKTLTS